MLASILLLGLFAAGAPAIQPDWTRHLFQAKPDAVFTAAEKAIASHHEIKSEDPKTDIIRFHVGTTAWSWGYTMTLSIAPKGDGSLATISIERSGGPALSWGSGKKEVGKIYRWTEQNLQAATQ